jgi:hypothetical protein
MTDEPKSPGTVFPTADPEYSLTGDAIRQDQLREGGVGTAPAPGEGMHRYPTEPPTGNSSHRGGSPGRTAMWSAAGALAGAAATMIGMKLAGRRRTGSARGPVPERGHDRDELS